VFLTPSEIQTLTGKKRPSAQIRWLREKGYAHTVNGAGDPVVAVAEVSRKLVGGAQQRTRTPNWDALNRGTQEAA
jgi:hypothetical protein